MDRREFLKATATATTIGAVGVAGCVSAPSEGDGGGQQPSPTETPAQTPTATPTPSKGGGSKRTIRMETEGEEYYFDPIGLFVKSGETVTFKIESGSHSSTAYEKGNGPATVTRIPKDAKAWNSDIMSEKGATFDHTFEVEGTYDYFCIPHKSLGMVGRIVVGKAGGPAEGSIPPDGKVPESQTIVDQGAVPHDQFSG